MCAGSLRPTRIVIANGPYEVRHYPFNDGSHLCTDVTRRQG